MLPNERKTLNIAKDERLDLLIKDEFRFSTSGDTVVVTENSVCADKFQDRVYIYTSDLKLRKQEAEAFQVPSYVTKTINYHSDGEIERVMKLEATCIPKSEITKVILSGERFSAEATTIRMAGGMGCIILLPWCLMAIGMGVGTGGG